MSRTTPRGYALAVTLPCRLEKWLRDATTLSRSAARAAIEAGRVEVLVRGESVVGGAQQLVYADDAVQLDGAPLERRRAHVAALLHKPTGVTSSARDSHGRDDLSAYAAKMPAGCRPVGRLDRDSSGALLFTSDGDLGNALMRPQNHAPKHYALRVDGALEAVDPRLEAMRAGVDSPVGRLTVQSIEVVDRGTESSTLHVVLTSGKNRHLRRMCFATKLRLRALHRVAIGPIALGELPVGTHRVLSADEVEALWHTAGGRERVRGLQLEALVDRADEARRAGSPDARLERWLEAATLAAR